MSLAITDTNNVPLSSVALSLTESTESAVLIGRVPCSSGAYLVSVASAFAQVLARRTGSGDAFVNLASSPLSLSAYAGQTVDFDFKVAALSVTAQQRVELPVRVERL